MKLAKIVLLMCMVIVYVLIINIFASILSISIENAEIRSSNGGGMLKIGVSESVSILVTRNRWYGKILEENGHSILYLFRFVKLPIRVKKLNFIYYHVIFLFILTALIILFSLNKKVYKDKKPNYDYEMVDKNYTHRYW